MSRKITQVIVKILYTDREENRLKINSFYRKLCSVGKNSRTYGWIGVARPLSVCTHLPVFSHLLELLAWQKHRPRWHIAAQQFRPLFVVGSRSFSLFWTWKMISLSSFQLSWRTTFFDWNDYVTNLKWERGGSLTGIPIIKILAINLEIFQQPMNRIFIFLNHLCFFFFFYKSKIKIVSF